MIVPDLVHPFFGEVAKALSAILRGKGYSLVLSSSEDDPQLERQEIDNLLARRVDVLAVASVQSEGEVFRRIQEQKATPLVLIDRRFEAVAAHFVGVDDAQAGRIATEHLLEVGCRLLAHIGGPDVSTAAGRLQATGKFWPDGIFGSDLEPSSHGSTETMQASAAVTIACCGCSSSDPVRTGSSVTTIHG